MLNIIHYVNYLQLCLDCCNTGKLLCCNPSWHMRTDTLLMALGTLLLFFLVLKDSFFQYCCNNLFWNKKNMKFCELYLFYISPHDNAPSLSILPALSFLLKHSVWSCFASSPYFLFMANLNYFVFSWLLLSFWYFLCTVSYFLTIFTPSCSLIYYSHPSFHCTVMFVS